MDGARPVALLLTAFAVSLGIIVATCLVAAFFPARRAAHIDPIATLRAD